MINFSEYFPLYKIDDDLYHNYYMDAYTNLYDIDGKFGLIKVTKLNRRDITLEELKNIVIQDKAFISFQEEKLTFPLFNLGIFGCAYSFFYIDKDMNLYSIYNGTIKKESNYVFLLYQNDEKSRDFFTFSIDQIKMILPSCKPFLDYLDRDIVNPSIVESNTVNEELLDKIKKHNKMICIVDMNNFEYKLLKLVNNHKEGLEAIQTLLMTENYSNKILGLITISDILYKDKDEIKCL